MATSWCLAILRRIFCLELGGATPGRNTTKSIKASMVNHLTHVIGPYMSINSIDICLHGTLQSSAGRKKFPMGTLYIPRWRLTRSFGVRVREVREKVQYFTMLGSCSAKIPIVRRSQVRSATNFFNSIAHSERLLLYLKERNLDLLQGNQSIRQVSINDWGLVSTRSLADVTIPAVCRVSGMLHARLSIGCLLDHLSDTPDVIFPSFLPAHLLRLKSCKISFRLVIVRVCAPPDLE